MDWRCRSKHSFTVGDIGEFPQEIKCNSEDKARDESLVTVETAEWVKLPVERFNE